MNNNEDEVLKNLEEIKNLPKKEIFKMAVYAILVMAGFCLFSLAIGGLD